MYEPPSTAPKRAVFLDKDGTLLQNVPYSVDDEHLPFAPFALEALRRLAKAGYRLLVVTNQPGVALGRFDEASLHAHLNALRQRALAAGIEIDATYACTHAPDAGCDCRKPADGLLRRAAREHGIDLAASWMVGDILDDVEAGRRAGCRTVLVDVGNETRWEMSPTRTPHFCVTNLLDMARLIAVRSRRPSPAAVVA